MRLSSGFAPDPNRGALVKQTSDRGRWFVSTGDRDDLKRCGSLLRIKSEAANFHALRFVLECLMSAFRFGRACPISRVALVAVSAFALSACASSTGSQTYRASVGAPVPAAMPVPQKPETPEVEADGLPVQTAPFRTTRPVEDDPTEPFSPNYGSAPVGEQRPRVAPGQSAHDRSNRAEPRIVASRHLSPREEMIVMTRAISEHERRNP